MSTDTVTQSPVVAGQAIAKALATVQGKLHSVGKDRDVEVKSEKGRYTFRYATLAAIWDVIRAPCSEAGLAIVQFPTVDIQAKLVTVETRVLHVSGEFLISKCVLPLGQRIDPQAIGAIISYARRYDLSALLGVTQDDENEEQVIDDLRGPPPAPPPQSATRPTPPPKTPAKPAAPVEPQPGAPQSKEEAEQQMRSCQSAVELAKVASKFSHFTDADRNYLISVYRTCLAALKGVTP
jgi:hypothetical protein